MRKTSGKYFAILFIALGTALSCNLDDGANIPIPETDLVDVLSNTSELSILVSALQRADLVSTFEGTTLYTVLAPTNTAFTNFLNEEGYSGIDAVPEATLRQILLNHVLSNRVDAAVLSNLQKNYLQTFADGPSSDTKLSIYFDATSGVVFNGAAKVITADILASNGLIHTLDQVIVPSTLETFISTDENFEDLETALDLVSPLTELPDMLADSGSGPFTVFAPTNEAFDDLLATNDNWNFISDIDESLLTSVLAHHAVSGNLRKADLENSESLTSLEGDELLVGSAAGLIELTDGSGNAGSAIIATNIQASNGVIHLIDTVLLPDTAN